MRRASSTIILFFAFLLAAQSLMVPLLLPQPVHSSAQTVVTRQSRINTDDIRFGFNTKVTDGSSPYLWQVEPTLTILSTGRVLCGWKEADSHNGPGLRVGFAYSTDMGKTWSTNILMDPVGPGEQQSDPWLLKDDDDNAYFTFLEYGGTGEGMGVAKTTDGGLSWQGPVQASDTEGYLDDKETVCVDENGNLYMVWDHSVTETTANLVFTKSTNGGASFQPTTVLGSWEERGGIPYIACTPNGTLYVSTILDSTGGQIDTIYMTKSVDFGATWTPPIRVNPISTDVIDIITVTALDSEGNVFVAFAEGSDTDRDIYITRSEDGGTTWSPPVRVNDVTTNMQRMTELYIDEDDNLHVAWLDARLDEWNYYYSFSNDSGVTFSPNIRISAEGFSLLYNRPGDYITLRGGPNGLAIVWTDGRGVDHDIYYAKQDLSAPVITHVPVPSWYVNTPLTLQAEVTDDDHVESVILYLGSGAASRQVLVMNEVTDDIYEVTIPAEYLTGTQLEYVIVAQDTAGRETRLYITGDEGYTLPLSPITPTLVLTLVIAVVVIVIVLIFAIWYLRHKPAK
ncbi:MAG: sialidase family protein [Promethearchaeota archaeon]